MPTGSHQQEWVLDPPAGTQGLVVAFALGRTQVLQVRLDRGEPSRFLRKATGGRDSVWILEEPVLGPQRLRVLFDGNVPLVARLAWIRDGGADATRAALVVPRQYAPLLELSVVEAVPAALAELLEERLATVGLPAEILAPGEVEAFVRRNSPDPVELFRERDRAVRLHARAQRFFLRLDRATRAELVPEAWRERMKRVGLRLDHRIETRARHACSGNAPAFPPIRSDWSLGRRELGDLVGASAFLADRIRDEEWEGDTGFVSWAFELFATDRIAVQHPEEHWHGHLQGHGAANGLPFLQFAELAFYALENDVDADLWRRHVGTLVRAVHAFVETARTPFGRPTGSYLFHEGRVHPRTRLESLRVEYGTAEGISAPLGPLRFHEERFCWLAMEAHPEHAGSPPGPSKHALRPEHRPVLQPTVATLPAL